MGDELRMDVVAARRFARLELTYGLTELICCKVSQEVGINTVRSQDGRHLARCQSGEVFVCVREAAVLQELGCDGIYYYIT